MRRILLSLAMVGGGSLEPQSLCDALVAEVSRRNAGEVHDDLAILVLKVLAADDPAGASRFTILEVASGAST